MFTWTRTAPGDYAGAEGTRTARISRQREGSLYCNDVMWVLEIDGQHVANADTLQDAKVAAAELAEIPAR